jgi:hypothetical protein
MLQNNFGQATRAAEKRGSQINAIHDDVAVIRNLRRQRHVEQICRIPRLVYELLDEIGRHHGIADDIDRRLERYARLDPPVLAAVGGDRFPPSPIRALKAAP